MEIPLIDKEIRKLGLKRSQELRIKRASIKTRLKKGKINLQDIIKDDKLYIEVISGMKVLDIIAAVPGIGKLTAARILKSLNISSKKRIGGLGVRQKVRFYKYFNLNDKE